MFDNEQCCATLHRQNSLQRAKAFNLDNRTNQGTNPYYTNSLDDLKQSLKLDPKYIKALMIGCAWQESFFDLLMSIAAY